MKIHSDYPHLSKMFLELLPLSKEFKTLFQTLAPEIYADIESASTNLNCSCRAKVENFVNSNKTKCVDFYNQLPLEITSLVNFQEIDEKYKSVVYVGKIERVKKSEWNKFEEKLTSEKAVFRSFSVVKVDEEYVDVFFL